MFISKVEFEQTKAENEQMKAENEQLKNQLEQYKQYKEIVDLQNSEDMKRIMEQHEKDEKERIKQQYCIGCIHAILNLLPERRKGEYLRCAINGRKICDNFQQI